MDWKCSVKKKLTHNRAEVHATGGGRFNQFILSANENEVAQISGLFAIVKGVVENALASGVRQSAAEEIEINNAVTTANSTLHDDVSMAVNTAILPSVSHDSFITKTKEWDNLSANISNATHDEDPIYVEENIDFLPSCSKKRKHTEKQPHVGDIIQCEIEAFNNIASKIDTSNHILQDICNVLKEATEENRRHNLQMESLVKNQKE